MKNDNMVTVALTLESHVVEKLKALAAEKHPIGNRGNISMMLREIVRDWLEAHGE